MPGLLSRPRIVPRAVGRPMLERTLWALGCALLAWAPAAWAAQAAADGASHRVEVRGEWIYVDGEAFLVKAIGYSPYRPGQVPWRDRVTREVLARDFERIAAAGFNTLRTWAPLNDDALALAHRHGLMVLQGIWVEREGDYSAAAFRDAMFSIVRREADRAKGHPNVLALLIGNELFPEQVYRTGIAETESLLARAAGAVRERDPARLVSYANWPALAFLEVAPWNLVCFNVYPYEPASVSHSFGFRSYLEHLRREVARGKPFVVSEVGLSVSRPAGRMPGYGGFTPETQAARLVELWDDVFQAGAQGGVVFEWNDEWWKQAEFSGDEAQHDPQDPEEWFGLMEFQGPDDLVGRPRPAYEALKRYNQAILLSPVSGRAYEADRVQVTVYAMPQVASVRFQLGSAGWLSQWWPRWEQATRLSRHWWKATLDVHQLGPGEHPFIMEALDARGAVLVRRERLVTLGRSDPVIQVRISTDRDRYDANGELGELRYAVEVRDGAGQAVANRPVYLAIAEPQADLSVQHARPTDAAGRLEGTYLIHEPGLIAITAATPVEAAHPQRRVGAEKFVVVAGRSGPGHRPSPWEQGLPAAVRLGLRHDRPAFQMLDPGAEQVVSYEQYGDFHGEGTAAYRYEVRDWAGLARAAGEGVYPSESLVRNPAYQQAERAGLLAGSHWDFTFLPDRQRAFFKWATAEEEPGVRQFYTALTLERAGLWEHAVKAYYAVLVHFPRSIGWTAFAPPTPWYVGKVARDKVEAILRLHPEMGLRLEGAEVVIRNGFDNDVENDTIVVHPGRLVAAAPEALHRPTLDLGDVPVKREVGKGRVRLVQYGNGHWQLLVAGRPLTVRGITYQPSQVGESPDEGTLRDWMTTDRNGNGRIDAWDTFVDANRNNARDADEPVVGDFQLLKDMGVNTIRLYHHASNKPLLRELHERYGFMVLMGDLVGMYTVGSGAAWEEGTNYLDPEQRRRMTESVQQMVREHKDEPYLLLWVLGNENNYGGVHGIVGGVGNAGRYPREYYRFLNDLASWIRREDPNHPVAVANGDLGFLDILAKEAPAIDVIGANVYRGWHGVGRSFFEEVRRLVDKPVIVSEYGSPAYQADQPPEVAEADQALYHFGNWVDIADNLAGRGIGNALGGVLFEWCDEWWKAGQPPRFLPGVHETHPNWAGPFPGGWNFEEWFGIVSQGDGSLSPYLRQLRVSYDLYQSLWGATGQQ